MPGAPPPIVIVLTGPSGVGKDALIDRLAERGFDVVRPATMTTRAPRAGEVEGTHHYFVTREEFARQLASGGLLEHAEYDGNLYGVPRRSVRAALDTGRHVVLRVDVQGAESLRPLLPGALFLSLEPENVEVLQRHLLLRGTETPEQVAHRLATAQAEIARARDLRRRAQRRGRPRRDGGRGARADRAGAAAPRPGARRALTVEPVGKT